MQHAKPDWTLLSNHGMVLFHIAANPDLTLRQLSDRLGISERWVARIVKDLAEAEMVRVERRGLRNHYHINSDAHFRHPTLSHVRLARIIDAVVSDLKQNGNNVPNEQDFTAS